jgi:hypothetical protein
MMKLFQILIAAANSTDVKFSTAMAWKLYGVCSASFSCRLSTFLQW